MACKTTVKPLQEGVAVELMVNDLPFSTATLYHAQSSNVHGTVTLTGVKILQLFKNDRVRLRINVLGAKSFTVADKCARLAISQKRWW